MLEPAHVGHLAFIRALIREGAANGCFDRELASESPAAALFFTNLRRALQSGYFVQFDEHRAKTLPIHAPAYVYRPSGTDVPIGFGLFKEISDDCFELWLLATSAAHRRLGHGRAMIGCLMATPVGKLTLLARCTRATQGSEITARLLAEVGFVARRTTPEQMWLVHRSAPEDFVRRVTAAPLLRVAGS